MPGDPLPIETPNDLERLLRAALDGLDERVLMLDADGRVAYANAATAHDLREIEPSGLLQIEGQRHTDLCEWACARGISEARAVARGIGEVLAGTCESLERQVAFFADGREHVFRVRVRILAAVGAARALVTVSDVSEERRAERALHLAREHAYAASRAKSEFLANMSHEIRTPMNAIIGMTEILMQEAELEPTYAQYVQLVHSSAGNLLALLNDILDFSKVEARKLELEQIPFSLRSSLSDAVSLLGVRARQKGLDCRTSIECDVPDGLIGDPGRLRQVVVNLLSNAIKFTHRGEVVLRVAEESHDDEGCTLHFQVCDTGVGIPPEKQGAVFGAFAQADGSTAREYGGTGLGLAISEELVRLMGGRIWVESEPDAGSRFHFTAKFSLDRAVQVSALPTTDALAGMPVLVVDDGVAARALLADELRAGGMCPTSVDSAAAAVEAAETAQAAGRAFEVVLIDAHISGTDGFEIAERLRADPRNSSARIVLTTAAGQPGDGQRCRELALSGYLTKPISSRDLLAAVRLVISRPTPLAGAGELVTRHSVRELALRLDVLLAEDDESNRALAVHLLKKRGYRVTAVADGRKAFEAWREGSYDVILMDVQMPRWDGYEATRRIREAEHGTRVRVPIVALTAHAPAEDRERCLRAGMDGYVVKPIRADELFRTIQQLVDAR